MLKKYRGFTLIEMVVVLVITVILFAAGVVSVGDFRASMDLTNAVSFLEQDIRYAQRSAMFLSREIDEDWIYGIGVDFRDIDNTGEYHLFKWCAPFESFDPENEIMTSALPGFDPEYNLGVSLDGVANGGLPPGGLREGVCDRTVSELVKIGEYQTYKVPLTSLSLERHENGSFQPSYIVFESMTGRAFVYDANGQLINYDYSKSDDEPTFWGSTSRDVIPLAFRLRRKSAGSGGAWKLVSAAPVSGRITKGDTTIE
ncbi:prepilin-type N-terminal cleavage/methylation domain-containing protein [Candidatus Dojkabacteria bacterium]|nr:prepilin-type N-terminal cleavage/methylation domain-containing protein [Candidatus Dojkabacteria bacterium]